MNVIEISSSAIRLVRERDGRLLGMDSWPIPPGADPLVALSAAPLPNPLGRVTVLMHHDDMLIRSLLQPAADHERLNRLVRFELASMAGETGEATAISWHAVNVSLGDGAELRVLALLAKPALLTRLRDCLAVHGGRLVSLIPPSLGLYRAWRAQYPDEQGQVAIADIGGSRLHIVLVQNGEMIFLRTQTPGMDELVKAVAESRGLPESEASKLVARLGKGAPGDLHQLIAKHAGSMAAAITAAVRFAKSQLKLDTFEISRLYIAGAGAQVFGFSEALQERLAVPIGIINPFSGVLTALATDELDRLATLPSPWTNAIGAALAKSYELDALQDERSRKVQFWRTDGVLRIACAVVLGLGLIAIVHRELDILNAAHAVTNLGGEKHDGLVPSALAEHDKLGQLVVARQTAAAKLVWLDEQRRPGRIAVELLGAIAAQQDPQTCPVVLTTYHLDRTDQGVRVSIEGYAKSAGSKSTDIVLREFEEGLRHRYPPITDMVARTKPVALDNQPFAYDITLQDDAPGN